MQINPRIHPLHAVLGGEQPLPRVHYGFSCEAAPGLIARVRRVELDEGLSRTYELVVDLLVEHAEVDADALLASNCELCIDREGAARTICGVVSRVELHDRLESQQRVRLTVVPALRLLAQRSDTRLWQGLSALAVVEEVLRPALADYERELDTSRLSKSYPAREYIVQYCESDLDFVARLLEDEGIAYHFDHERGTGRELLVLDDAADHWAEVVTLDDNPSLAILASREEQAEVESIQRLTWDQAMQPTAVARRTFDWLTPTTPITARSEHEHARGPVRELYHHGRIVESDPEPRVVRELAHARAKAQILRGVSNVTGLAPGRRFFVVSPERPELEAHEFLVTGVRGRGDCPEAQLGESQGDHDYTNEFECVVLDERPWCPPLRAPIPKIHGPQTAIVTGPEGEEIHTDERGRVKVRFDWDREHELSDDTSMWIRVAHGWAGAGFGMLFIPRVGMEVVVEFIDGDPDRPLITGCVYNGEAEASVALPDNKTQSTIRSKSSPGGAGYNELRFEDAAGAEEIFIHAQRDLREQIGRNRTTNIGNNRSETIGADHRQIVRGDQTLTVEGTRTETVHGDEQVTHESSRLTVVYGEESLSTYDLATAVHRASLERRITGHDETIVYAPEGGWARSSCEVEGDLDTRVKHNATLTAGERIELVQGTPEAQAKAVFADGNLEQETEQAWRATAGTQASLTAGACLKLRGDELVELRSGNAAIRIHNDVVTIDAREIRLIVDDSELRLSETGLCSQTKAVDMTALAAITITGASVKID